MNETAEVVGAARGMIQRFSQEAGPVREADLVQVLERIEKLAIELDKSQSRMTELEKRLPRV